MALVFGAGAGVARVDEADGFTRVVLPAAADVLGQARQRYGVCGDGALVVIRPDGYVFGRWPREDLAAVRRELATRGVQA